MPKSNIQLSSGRYFDFDEPTALTIEEVANSLSKICRFTGHCRGFYSVAQHSVLVSKLLPPHLQLWGLLHDAGEVVMNDVSSPLKRKLPDYKAIELRCEMVIMAGFGLDMTYGMPSAVKHADMVALRTEQRDIMPGNDDWISLNGIQPATARVRPWPMWWARLRFLWRYKALVRQQQRINQGMAIA